VQYQLYPGLPRLSSPLWLGPSYMLPRSSFVCVHAAHAESFYFKAPPRLVTTPERWMIRPTYIANECVMIMWPKAFPGGRPNMWLLLSYFGYSWKHQTYKANQPSNRATEQLTSQLATQPTCLVCFCAVTTPQRWMIRPTYTVLLGGGAAPLFLF
jgi:hypothetical protein